jgi:hypothetical protein
MVGLAVFLVAHADERRLEEADHRGQNLLERQARQREMTRHASTDPRERARPNPSMRSYFASSRTCRQRPW